MRKRPAVASFHHSKMKHWNNRQNLLRRPNAKFSWISHHGTQDVDSLLSSAVSYPQRVFGMLVFLACLFVCCYQVYDRGSLYLSEPSTVNFFVTRNKSITFPAITFCSSLKPFFDAIKHDVMARLNYSFKDMNKSSYIAFKDHGLDLNQLWSDNAMNASSITLSVNSKLSTSYSGITTSFNGTLKNSIASYCNCLTFIPEKLLELKGRTLITIQFKTEGIFRTKGISKLYYKFHDARVSQRHESMGYEDFIPENGNSSLTLRITKFSYQKKKQYPCRNQLEVYDQQLKCIDEVIQNAEIPCRFPFIHARTDLEQCATLNDVWNAIHRIYEIYDQPDVMRCYRKEQICREITYVYRRPSKKYLSDSTCSFLKIFIPDNMFEVVQEGFTYTFPALLSDVGGSLGFFLGLSVFTLLEALRKICLLAVRILAGKYPHVRHR